MFGLQERSIRYSIQVQQRFRALGRCQQGIGTLELIFITIVVLGLAIVFRNQIVDVFQLMRTKLEALKGNIGTSMEIK